MSHLSVTATTHNPIQQPVHPCCTQTVLKVASLILGFLLIAGCILCHMYQVNAIAVYTMGSVGGALILTSAILMIIPYLRRRVENRAIDGLRALTSAQWHERAQNGDIGTIRRGLQHGIITDPTELINPSTCNGHAELVKLLLAHGADPRRSAEPRLSPLQDTALHWATTCADDTTSLVIMEAILAKDPSLVSSMNFRLSTPLHYAAGMHHKQQVELLIKSGADVNAQDNSKTTPLHEVFFNRQSEPNIEVVEMLVRAGAHRDARNQAGLTPMRIAQTCHPEWYKRPDIQRRLAALSNTSEPEMLS